MKPNVVRVSRKDADSLADIIEYILLNEDDNFYEELYNNYDGIEWTSLSLEAEAFLDGWLAYKDNALPFDNPF